MENTPEAAPQGTEAQPTNTNSTPAEAPVEQPQTPDTQGFTPEQLTEMKKFMDANGGYDKAFKTFKERISNPAPEAPKEPEQSVQPQQPQMTIEEQARVLQTPAGYMSQQEFMAQQYYNSLASEEAYAPIADKIRSGEMFNEMAKFGIRPMDENGNINNSQVREFFNLYAKTVPAAPAQTPEAAAAPTVDYVPVNGGKIESFEQAAQIIAQSEDLRGRGVAEHPELAAAKEFIKNSLAPKKK